SVVVVPPVPTVVPPVPTVVPPVPWVVPPVPSLPPVPVAVPPVPVLPPVPAALPPVPLVPPPSEQAISAAPSASARRHTADLLSFHETVIFIPPSFVRFVFLAEIRAPLYAKRLGVSTRERTACELRAC